MGDVAEADLISDLPQSIAESILTRLPIRDAVRTSILSSKWRYKWASLTHLVFDENCVPLSNERSLVENNLVKFITGALFLHHGPIHKFQLLTTNLQCGPDIDQWILFLSRNDTRELVLELGEGEWFKYLSIHDDPGRHPITYSHLKTIELYQVSFEDMKEILVVIRLIMNSPNLKELQISGSSNTEAPDLDFWEKECPSDCTFKQLKLVKMTDICGVPHEMELIKFLFKNSPVVEIMSITPGTFVNDGKLSMLIELVRCRRASAQAEILFVQE